eukprot:CFRG3525T1
MEMDERFGKLIELPLPRIEGVSPSIVCLSSPHASSRENTDISIVEPIKKEHDNVGDSVVSGKSLKISSNLPLIPASKLIQVYMNDEDVIGAQFVMGDEDSSTPLLEKTIPVFESEFTALQDSLADIKNKKYTVDAINARLKKEVDSLSKKNPSQAKVIALEKDCSRLRKELSNESEQRLAIARDFDDMREMISDQKETYRSNIVLITNENVRLKEANNLLAQHIRHLGTSSSTAAEINEKFEFNFEEVLVEHMSLQVLENHLEDTRKKLDNSERTVKELITSNHALDASLSAVKQDKRRIQSDYNDTKEILQSKFEAIQEYENSLVETETGMSNILKAKDKDYQELTVDLMMITKQLSAAQNAVNLKQCELDLLAAEFSRLKHFAVMTPNYELELQEVKKTISSLSTENLCLTNSLRKLKQSVQITVEENKKTNADSVQTLSSEMTAVKTSLAKCKAELETTNAQMVSEQLKHEEEQSTQIELRVQTEATLHNALKRLSESEAQIQSLSNERTTWESKIYRLTSDCEALRREIATANQTIEHTERTHARHILELETTYKQDRKKDAMLIKDLKRQLQQAIASEDGLSGGGGGGTTNLPYSFERLMLSQSPNVSPMPSVGVDRPNLGANVNESVKGGSTSRPRNVGGVINGEVISSSGTGVRSVVDTDEEKKRMGTKLKFYESHTKELEFEIKKQREYIQKLMSR